MFFWQANGWGAGMEVFLPLLPAAPLAGLVLINGFP